jgi:hypothetical protein
MRSITTLRRPSPAFILAIVALFVALGGSSYAAATMSGSKLKRESVPSSKIVPNSLTGKQIKESRLGTVPRASLADAAGSAETAKVADSAKALQGFDASKYLAGSVRVVSNQSAPQPTGSSTSISVSCNGNEKGIGGGAAWVVPADGSPSTLFNLLSASMPVPGNDGTDTMTGWQAAGYNASALPRVLKAYAICVPKTA